MNNFLGRLIDRAGGRAPVLARRQPSLFEPVAGQAPAGPALVEVETSPRPAMPPAVEVVATGRASARLVDHGDATPRTVRPPVAEPAVRSAPVAERLIQSVQEIHTRREVVERSVESKRASPPSGRSRADAGDPLPSQRKARPPESLAPLVEPQVPRVRREPAASELPRPTAKSVPPAAPAPPRRPAGESRTAGLPVSLLVPAPRSAPRAVQMAKFVQPRLAGQAAATATAEAPPVQITIGRVEVRAVQGAERATARTSRPQAPRLTLEDYLRQRNGGRQ